MHTADTCQPKKAQLLIKRGADVSLKNLMEETALDIAIKNSCVSVQEIIRKGARRPITEPYTDDPLLQTQNQAA
jgi:ankyrin repeat protein